MKDFGPSLNKWGQKGRVDFEALVSLKLCLLRLGTLEANL